MKPLGLISYLNSLTLRDGAAALGLDFVSDTPSEIAGRFEAGEFDFAQLSLSYFLEHEQGLVLHPNAALIASRGSIRSVLLFSQLELSEILRVSVTEQTVTSSQLLRVIFWERFGRDLDFSPRQGDDILDSCLLIGDQAFAQYKLYCAGFSEYLHCYDLVTLWTELTGLPFVFAVFAGRSGVPAPAQLSVWLELDFSAKTIQALDASEQEYLGLLDFVLTESATRAISTFRAKIGLLNEIRRK